MPRAYRLALACQCLALLTAAWNAVGVSDHPRRRRTNVQNDSRRDAWSCGAVSGAVCAYDGHRGSCCQPSRRDRCLGTKEGSEPSAFRTATAQLAREAGDIDLGVGWWIRRCRAERLLAADRDRGQPDDRVVRRRSDFLLSAPLLAGRPRSGILRRRCRRRTWRSFAAQRRLQPGRFDACSRTPRVRFRGGIGAGHRGRLCWRVRRLEQVHRRPRRPTLFDNWNGDKELVLTG